MWHHSAEHITQSCALPACACLRSQVWLQSGFKDEESSPTADLETSPGSPVVPSLAYCLCSQASVLMVGTGSQGTSLSSCPLGRNMNWLLPSLTGPSWQHVTGLHQGSRGELSTHPERHMSLPCLGPRRLSRGLRGSVHTPRNP